MSLLGVTDRLKAALERDNAREDDGMHADQREACFRCTGWAGDGHAHDPVTGRWMSAETWDREWAQFMKEANSEGERGR